MFLQREHKNLQFKYQKEKRNETLIKVLKQRIEELTKERDSAINNGMKLRKKFELFNDFMQLAVEENKLQQKEDEQLIEQLYEENAQLRSLLQIHRESQAKELVEEEMRE